MSFAREIYPQLIDWKRQPNRKPLIIQGARQVGKTHLLQHVVANEFKNHLYINFEKQESLTEKSRETKQTDQYTLISNRKH